MRLAEDLCDVILVSPLSELRSFKICVSRAVNRNVSKRTAGSAPPSGIEGSENAGEISCAGSK